MGRNLSAALFATLMVTAAGLAAAQAPPVTSPPFPASAPMPTNNPEALANVRESKQYNAVMRSNPAFRQKRMQQECGPITDPQLHASCVASFGSYK
jgi:hypothetical protein